MQHLQCPALSNDYELLDMRYEVYGLLPDLNFNIDEHNREVQENFGNEVMINSNMTTMNGSTLNYN